MGALTPWLDDGDVRLYLGDVREVLAAMPDESVDCVITSPPYWGLRDYGTGSWDGGDPACDHVQRDMRAAGMDGTTQNSQREGRTPPDDIRYRDVCGKCGARRVDQQLGLEPTPDAYVTSMVAVFREVFRVLAPHGTCWLNLGDSYAGSWGAQSRGNTTGEDKTTLGGSSSLSARQIKEAPAFGSLTGARGVGDGIKPKDLIGIPWAVAFALRADGWWLRSEIIWAKPNPMPESVTDRPTKSHEEIFLLSKRPVYWFDQEAVREPHKPDGRNVTTRTVANGSHDNYQEFGHEEGRERWPNGGRNVRSVWEIEQVGRPNGARHSLDDGYFHEIDTEEKAYWLGFLYADGYLGRRHVDLQLADRDRDHVLAFRAALNSSATVNTAREGRTRVVISSLRMAEDLRRWGLDTKSQVPDLSPELARHFVRGVFDGDGSAWKYLPTGRTKWRYAASFLGHEGVLTRIRSDLRLRGKPKLDRGIHRLAVAAADDLARLYAFMYDGATVWLERKRAEFPQAQSVAPTVWPIATQPFPDAHFATYPEELVRRCLLAGCPAEVCHALTCCKCGLPHPTATLESLWDAETGRDEVPESNAVQAELRRVRDVLREQESTRLLEELRREAADRGPQGVGEADGELQGRPDQPSGLYPSVAAGLQVGHDSEGLRAGASVRDGAAPRAAVAAVGEGASQERGQGGQPLSEPGDRDALDAPWRGRVPGLRDALLRSLTCPSCQCWGFRVCGKPRERIVERERPTTEVPMTPREKAQREEAARLYGEAGNQKSRGLSEIWTNAKATRIVGESWSDCGHNAYRPGRVLDPFLGSGTTALVARNHGRHAVGIELNEEYARIAARRLQQLSLLGGPPVADSFWKLG